MGAFLLSTSPFLSPNVKGAKELGEVKKRQAFLFNLLYRKLAAGK